MLVLSRKTGQKLQIGENVTITVLDVRGHVMKLGIEAPRGVRVLRGELDSWPVAESSPESRGRVRVAMAG